MKLNVRCVFFDFYDIRLCISIGIINNSVINFGFENIFVDDECVIVGVVEENVVCVIDVNLVIVVCIMNLVIFLNVQKVCECGGGICIGIV